MIQQESIQDFFFLVFILWNVKVIFENFFILFRKILFITKDEIQLFKFEQNIISLSPPAKVLLPGKNILFTTKCKFQNLAK